MHHVDGQTGRVMTGQLCFYLLFISHEENLVAKFTGRLHCSGYIRAGVQVAAHGVNHDAHQFK